MGANSILRLDRKDCTGCGACYNTCPVDAISMQRDAEGFLFPVVDEGKCTNCGLCSRACAALNPSFVNAKNPACYAVWADDEIREVSSSGGMFSLVADYILDKGGYVCGAAYSDDYMSVRHIIISDKADLPRLRGSKYVQSDTGTVYKEIRALLDADKYVLFTGCPCQVAGMYAFLGREYEKLLTLDIVCHGANSLKAYHKFLEERAKGRTIEKVDFREKKVYRWSTPTTIYFTDGSVFRAPWNVCTWYKGFLNGVINRNVCGHCPYAQPQRQGDITLADFWQIHRYDPTLDDRRGTSLVLVNSAKGEAVFSDIRKNMKLCQKVPIQHALQYNGQLHTPQKPHPRRSRFFDMLDKHGYDKAVDYTLHDKYHVGLMGFWTSCNYGSILTYYALHQIIRSFGLSVLMIEKPYIWENDIEYTDTHARVFGKEFYQISKRRRLNELRVLNDHCEMFMIGSDQAWRYEISKHYGYCMFLDFADDEKKKIAYATSFGGEGYYSTEDYRRKAAFYLQRMDAISVREEQAVRICKETFNAEATHVLDPIFVCDMENYESLIADADASEEGDYIVTYILDPTPEKRKALLDASSRLNMKLVNILDGLPLKFPGNKQKLGLDNIKENVSAKEFLYYFKNSKFVITDSFHGTCFAILFKKPFISIANASRGIPRFVSILSQLGLPDRLVYNAMEIEGKDYLFNDIDYDKVYEILEREKARSLKWLKDALEAPKAPRPSAYDILSRENDALRERIDKLNGELDTIKKALKLQKEAAKPKPKPQKKSKAAKFRASLKKNGLRATLRRTVRHLQKRK